MLSRIHMIAGLTATITIAIFFISTIIGEIYSHQAIATIKSLIVMPGLLILLPAIITTGISGFMLARIRNGRLVGIKKKRMVFIAANGLIILVPCAILLKHLAMTNAFTIIFYVAQGIELIAGATNLILMGLNIRDGFRMSGRLRRIFL